MRKVAVSHMLLLAFVVLALVGPALAPYDPGALDLTRQFELPSSAHLLGTGDNGIDLLSALLHGARLALRIAVSVVFITATVGTLLGIVSVFAHSAVSHAIASIMDVLQAFPSILLQVAMLSLIADASFVHLVIALSLPGWVLYARIARSKALSLRQSNYVEAAVALGVPFPRLLLRHLLPNLMGPIVVQATTAAGGVILAEATLSFLGLGPTKDVSWGALLDQGSGVLLAHPHVALISGGAIAAVVMTTNLAGDALAKRSR